MRALLLKELGSYKNLTLETAPDPVPGKGEVLIDVRAAALNFPDLLIVEGKYQFRPDLPFSPGGECSGIVAALGEGVTSLAVGDPVVGMEIAGAFAEKMVVPENSALRVPHGFDFETAAGISITYGTSYYALKQLAKIRAGETLLVLGAAGGVGLAAVELGKVLGARVIAAASSEEKLEAARQAGADDTIDYSTESLKERVKELTRKQGADVIYDPVGGELSESALRAIAWNGRFLVIGFAAGEIPKIPLNLPLLKGAAIHGVFWGSWIKRDPAASAANYHELWRMFEDGRLRPRVKVFSFEDHQEAYAALAERRAIGKLVLKIQDDGKAPAKRATSA